ncbi:AAEL010880-PA [Aedes aegypti]|uniref:AAEL010880-PA n=1 Tax=Aedes aegypti TaxID=7159 RepID=Q16RP9_AEDAE|nr:AAEL010880-PA [Aedes aegypti]
MTLYASRYELLNGSFHWLIIDKKPNVDSSIGTANAFARTIAVAASDSERWTNEYRYRSAEHGPGCHPLANFTKPSNPPGEHYGLTAAANRDQERPGDDDDAVGDYYDTGPVDGDVVDEIFGRFETMNISINAEITLVKALAGDASHRDFALFDIWNPGFISGGRLNVTAMGNYTADQHRDGNGLLYVRFRESTVVRRRDMNGLRLKIMTVVTQKPREPFEVYLSTPKNTHLDSVHRYNFGLMSYLKDYFNFRFIMRRTKSWGYLRNGTFDGMIGALARREVDLGGSPMFFRQERHRVVSYTTRSFIERPCFIFRHPRRQQTMRNPFLLPFETTIWYMMVACGAILVVVLFTSFYFEDSAEKFSKSILLFLGGVCQQGLSEIPHLPSGKCTSMFILIFGYLMFQYYSATIVGSLLMVPPKNIRTIRNLIDSKLTLGIEDIPYSRDYFVRTTDEDSLELYRTRVSFYNPKTGQNESHFLNAADGLALVKAGGYAFHVAVSAGYKIIRETFSEREVCELAEIDMFPKSAQWMVAIVQKNSPYRDVITYGLRRLNEAGIMDHQRHVWQEPKPKCVRKMAPTDLIVGLDSVYSAFILLLAGALVSIGLLLIEILHHQLRLAKNGWPSRHQHHHHRRFNVGNFPQQQKPPLQGQQLWDHDLVYPYVD